MLGLPSSGRSRHFTPSWREYCEVWGGFSEGRGPPGRYGPTNQFYFQASLAFAKQLLWLGLKGCPLWWGKPWFLQGSAPLFRAALAKKGER